MRKKLFQFCISMATIVPLISFGMHVSAQSAQKTSGFESLNSVSAPPPAKEAHAPVLKPAKNNDGLKSASDYTFSTKKVSAHAPVVPGSAPIYGCLLSNPYSIILLPTDGTTTTVTSVASDENLNANGGAVCNGTTYYYQLQHRMVFIHNHLQIQCRDMGVQRSKKCQYIGTVHRHGIRPVD